MTPQSTYRLISGDCLDRLREMPEYLALARDRIRHWAPMWATDVSE